VRELDNQGTGPSRATMYDDGAVGGVAELQAAVSEHSPPGGQTCEGQRRGRLESYGVGDRSQVACLDGDILGGAAVAVPVGQPEDTVTDLETGGAIANFGDNAGHLVCGDARRAVAAGPIRPGSWPVELVGHEGCGVHSDDHVTGGGVRVGGILEHE
jgi:hypothetical protein